MEGLDRDRISRRGRDAMDDSFRMLVSRLGALDDPRQAGKVSYPLVEMSMVAVAGVIAWTGSDGSSPLRMACRHMTPLPECSQWSMWSNSKRASRGGLRRHSHVRLMNRRCPISHRRPVNRLLQPSALMFRLTERRCVVLTIAFRRDHHFTS